MQQIRPRFVPSAGDRIEQVFRLTHHRQGARLLGSPMADFRPALCLRAYGGGSARASHPVVYYPAKAFLWLRLKRALDLSFRFILFSAARFVKTAQCTLS
jgi:hypothetical protein